MNSIRRSPISSLFHELARMDEAIDILLRVKSGDIPCDWPTSKVNKTITFYRDIRRQMREKALDFTQQEINRVVGTSKPLRLTVQPNTNSYFLVLVGQNLRSHITDARDLGNLFYLIGSLKDNFGLDNTIDALDRQYIYFEIF